MDYNMKNCETCGGAVGEVGEVTGYAGKWCSCLKMIADMKAMEFNLAQLNPGISHFQRGVVNNKTVTLKLLTVCKIYGLLTTLPGELFEKGILEEIEEALK